MFSSAWWRPAADPARRQRPGRTRLFLPGAAEAGGQRAGEQELCAGCHDDPHPAVCLLGTADLGGGEPGSALGELEGMLDVGPGEVGAPELAGGQGPGAGVP